jgi:3-hydroxyacyl-CoA dehydrogenase
MTRQEYVTLMKETFITLGVKAVMMEMTSRAAFLAWPFFNPVATMLVKYIVTKLATTGETAAFFLYIDTRVGKQADAFEAAAIKNFLAQKSGSAQEKLDAENNLKRTFAEFVVLTN